MIVYANKIYIYILIHSKLSNNGVGFTGDTTWVISFFNLLDITPEPLK